MSASTIFTLNAIQILLKPENRKFNFKSVSSERKKGECNHQ